MKPDLEKVMQEHISSLPKVIQRLLLGDEWKRWVGDVVKKNNLNLDQASSLEAEIFVFLIGMNNIFDLRKGIQSELNIPVSQVNDIMIDINDMIVEPLKHRLMEATDNGEAIGQAPASIAESIALKEKEEEILDRQKVLSAIEEADHAPGVGVYVPKPKNVQPIAEAQISSGASEKSPAIEPPHNVIASRPIPAPGEVKKEPVNIFEAKTQSVVAPEPKRAVASVPSHDAEKPQTKQPPASSDPYREPIE